MDIIYEIVFDGEVLGYAESEEEACRMVDGALTHEERERAEIQALPISSLLSILSPSARYVYGEGGVSALVQHLNSVLHEEWWENLE